MNLVPRPPHPQREAGLQIGLLGLAVLSLWGLSIAGVEALSVTRAYTSMASAWSVSQRDAAFHLTQYAATRNPADYADFLRAAKQPAGARRALAELASSRPNYAVARSAFLDTGVEDRDVDEILRSAGIVRRLGLSRTFLERRTALDAEVEKLRDLASLLHSQIVAPDPSPARLAFILNRVHDTKHRANDLEAEFSRDVARVSRRVKAVALAAISVVALGVLGLCALLAHGWLRVIGRVETSCRRDENGTGAPVRARDAVAGASCAADGLRLSVLVPGGRPEQVHLGTDRCDWDLMEHASDGFFVCDADGRFLRANRRACDLAGRDHDELLAMTVYDLLAPEEMAGSPPRLELVTQDRVVRVGTRIERRPGTVIPVEISARRAPGGLVQALVRRASAHRGAETPLLRRV